MLTEHSHIIINIACIAYLFIMLTIMAAATRMKGSVSWIVIIIITTLLPSFLRNLVRDLHLGADMFLLLNYTSAFFNVLLMPALWFFTRIQLDKSFRFTARSLLHVVLPLVSLLSAITYYAPLSAEQIEVEMAIMASEEAKNLPEIINDVIGIGLFYAYCIAIYVFIRKRKKYLLDNYSDSDYMNVKWTLSFLIVYFVLFSVAAVVYIVNPRVDTWLCPIMTVVAVTYLIYVVILHSTTAYINRLPDMPADADKQEKTASLPAMSHGQMKEICEKTLNYLASSGVYTNPDLSLSMLSVETGISFSNLSRSLNGYLNKNFFDLINEMRVEEAKKKLRLMNENRLTIETIAGECGFRSRSAFYAAFRKTEHKSPTQWLKSNT